MEEGKRLSGETGEITRIRGTLKKTDLLAIKILRSCIYRWTARQLQSSITRCEVRKIRIFLRSEFFTAYRWRLTHAKEKRLGKDGIAMAEPPPRWTPGDPQETIKKLEDDANFDRVNPSDDRMLDPMAMGKLSKHELERKRRRDMVRAASAQYKQHSDPPPHSNCRTVPRP